MKKCVIIPLIALYVSISSFAATCPRVEEFTPENPPAGWNILVPPIIEDQKYHFGKAIHSLNGSFYYEQIICEYESCPSFGCPKFSIISTETYTFPLSKDPPWNTKPVIGFTLVCNPPDHNTNVCQFSN